MKVSHSLILAEGVVADIATAALNKDTEELTAKTKELQGIVAATTKKKVTKMGGDIDNNIFMVESFLPTLNSTGNRLAGLTIIGAPSGGGKSVYCVNEITHQWKSGNNTVYFSLELPAKLLEARILSNLTEVPLKAILEDLLPPDIRTPLLPEYEVKLEAIRKELASEDTADIYIFDNMFSPADIENTIVEYSQEYGISLFVLDYLNLMSAKTNADGNSWASKAEFTKRLNQLCLENNIVVLCPTQIDITKGTDGSLEMRTRGTTELLNTSSLAILLYRPEGVEGLIQLEITKSRNSGKVKVALADLLHIQKFEDLGQV